MWASPLPQAKPKEKKEDPIPKKPKPLISKAGAKSILGIKKIDALGAFWVQHWVDQLVRENSYPPQLVGDDFVSMLGKFFAPDKASELLERVRKEYRASHSWDKADDFEYLIRAIEADPMAKAFLEQL